MSDGSWYERWLARLASGDSAPEPFEAGWWGAWAEAVRLAPSVAEARAIPEREARRPPPGVRGEG